MKRVLFILGLLLTLSVGNSYAQKYALIDMEYILKQIPTYESANKQMEAMSDEWQSEVDKEVELVNAMYKKYQADIAFLAGSEKTKRENEIVAKENAIQELRNQYFGPQGALFEQQEKLIKPIQDSIYEAIKDLSNEQGYALVVDRASATAVIFASPSIDISDLVLARLGY